MCDMLKKVVADGRWDEWLQYARPVADGRRGLRE